ncbi:hypothetical protein GCM10029978_046030 [Actinoallomurus acanthiterrae]
MGDDDVWDGQVWPVPIPLITTGQLVDLVAYLRVHASGDEVLIRAVQTELTFRQAGIRPEPGSGGWGAQGVMAEVARPEPCGAPGPHDGAAGHGLRSWSRTRSRVLFGR